MMKINSYTELLKLVNYRYSEERDLFCDIKKLQQNFIGERQQGYSFDERLVAAYTLFYLPTNFSKWQLLMEKVQQEKEGKQIIEKLKGLCEHAMFIDVGSGPGTFLLAFLNWMDRPFKGQILAVEQSSVMREQAQRLMEAFFPKVLDNCRWVTSLSQICVQSDDRRNRRPKVLFFGHFLNEITGRKQEEEVVMTAIEKLAPDFIFFIEPATADIFYTQILVWRARILGLGDYLQMFPCTVNNNCDCAGPCTKGSWCHQVGKAEADEGYHRISQRVGIDRRYLPFSATIFRRKELSCGFRVDEVLAEDDGKIMGRVLRFLGENKAGFFLELCVSAKMYSYEFWSVEIQKRKLSKLYMEKLRAILVGDLIPLKVDRKLNDGRYRIVPEDWW
ncbi:MAG: hypothetical protein HQK53_02115 [Oligoflexia bacterium]|nr:hypothetical protein [Oligoflexia bacterium]